MQLSDLKKRAQLIVQSLKKFKDNGGHLYLDRSFNIHVTSAKPSRQKVFLGPVHWLNQKEKKAKKTEAIQNRLSSLGVALKSDVEKLEREIAEIKKLLKKKANKK